MRPSDVVLVLLLLCLFSPAIFALSEHSETTLTLQVEPKSVECFYEDVESLEDVTVYYQVLRGGLLDIKVIITEYVEGREPKELLHVLHFEDEGDGVFDFRADANGGTYKICFSNEMARWTAKVVTFTVQVGEWWETPETMEDIPENPKAVMTSDHLESVDDQIRRCFHQMDKIMHHQNYLAGQEVTHHALTESTNNKMFYWSVLEAMALLSVSLLQVYTIRRFFNNPARVRV